VKAVLLAAGEARRLRPLTDDRPKCLLDVGSETILARAVRILAENGIDRFTVVDGYRGDMIRSALNAGFSGLDFSFIRNEDFASTNNAWSLMLADHDVTEPMFLLDSDIVFEPAVIRRLLEHPAPNRLGLRTTGEIGAEEMKAALAADGRVSGLSKELDPLAAAGESVGLEIFSPEFVAALYPVLRRRLHEEARVNEFYEAAFAELIDTGHEVRPVNLESLICLEIDTAEDLAAARRIVGDS